MAEANFESLNLEISVRASEAVTQIKDLTDALGGLKKVLGGMGALGSLGQGVENIAKKAEDTAQRVRQATKDIQSAVDQSASSAALPNNFWGATGAVEIEEAADQIEEVQEQIQEEVAQTQEVVHGATEDVAQQLEHVSGVSLEGLKTAFTAALGPIGMVVDAFKLAYKIAMLVVDQFNEFINTIKKFKKVMDGLNERFNPFVGLKKELGYLLSLAKRQILRRAINAAIKAVTEGLKSGVENLAQYDERFSEVVQSFHNAMGLFKNSIGVAVAPIIAYFIPALNSLLAALTNVMNTLARLTALLTGQHTYTVAKSYEDIGDSAGGASSKVKELQRTILGFDEINKLNRPSGSGGGGGGGAGDAISAYETLSVGDWPYSSWGEALLAFLEWLNGTGVPKLRDGLRKIAETVNNFTRNFYEAFTFEGVQEQIAQLGRNVASALNDFLVNGEGNGGINWTDLGNAVGVAIKSLFNFTGNFFRDFDFMGLGSRFAEAFNAALQQITTEDVNNIADTIFGILTSGIQVAIGFLMDANLGDLGFRAGEFLNRIIEGIEKLFGGSTGEKGGPYYSNLEIIANNVAKALVNFFDTVNWAQLFGTLTNIVTSIANGLQTIIKGLMQNKEFMNALRSFVEFVAKTAVQWFITKLKFYMGVGGGLNIWQMLASSVFGNEENPLYESFNINPNELNGFVDGLDEASDAIEGVGDASRTAAAVTKTSAPVISNAVEQVAQNVSISGRNTVNAFRTMTTDSQKPLSDLSKNVGDQFGKVNTSVTDNMSKARTSVSSEAEAMRAYMAQRMNAMSTNAASEAENVRKAVVGKITETKNSLPAFTDVGKNIKDGIIGGMGDFKGKLDEWASQFKKRILDNFLVKSPSRWARDAVGTYISEGIAVGMMDGSRSVEQACAGLKEGISSEFSNMSFVGNVRTGGIDIAGAIGNQVMAGVASMTTNNQQPIVCEVYLDRDKIATAVTRGQRAQNRRYSPTALAY